MSKIRIGKIDGNQITIGDCNTVVNETSMDDDSARYSDEELIESVLIYLFEHSNDKGLYLKGVVLKNSVDVSNIGKSQISRVKTALIGGGLVEELSSYQAGDSRVRISHKGIHTVNSLNSAFEEVKKRGKEWTFEDFNEIFELKPNFAGIGINFNEVIKRFLKRKR